MKSTRTLFHRFSLGLLVCSLWLLVTAGSMNPGQQSSAVQSSSSHAVHDSISSPAVNRFKQKLGHALDDLKRKKEHANSQTGPEPKDSIVLLSRIALAMAILALSLVAIGAAVALLPAIGPILFAISVALFPVLSFGPSFLYIGGLIIIISNIFGIVTLRRIKKSGRKDQYIKTKFRTIGAMVLPFGILILFIAGVMFLISQLQG